MKNISINFKLEIFIVFLMHLTAFNISGQEAKQKILHTSDSYKFTFQQPEDSAKQSNSTEQRTIYLGEKSKFGSGSRLDFIVNETEGAKEISQLLATDEGMEIIASGFIKNLKGKSTDIEFSVLEKKRIKIAGLNGVKIVTSNISPDKKLRGEMFVVPVPEQKRMYIFIIFAFDSDFEKWFPIAEASVNSFELLKSESK